MAKIEMDVSEYEAMKENKKLLEDSLKRERELQDSIKKLNDEKLKAYEEAQCKIVQYVNTTTTEDLIASDWQELGNLEFALTKYVNAKSSYREFDNPCADYYRPSLLRILKESVKKTSTTKSEISKIETTNLDVYKQEVEAKLRAEFGEVLVTAENTISDAAFFEGKIQELQDKIKELSESNGALTKERDSLSRSAKAVKEELGKIKITSTEKEKTLIKTVDEVKETTSKLSNISRELQGYRTVLQEVVELSKHDSLFNNREVVKQIRDKVKDYNAD